MNQKLIQTTIQLINMLHSELGQLASDEHSIRFTAKHFMNSLI